MNAPPRRKRAPLSATTSAQRKICSRDSIEQGPAITTISVPPISQSRILTLRTLSLIEALHWPNGPAGAARRCGMLRPAARERQRKRSMLGA